MSQREQIIEDFRWWQAKFPGEVVPWQVMFIQRPDTISPETMEAARRTWSSVVAASTAQPSDQREET